MTAKKKSQRAKRPPAAGTACVRARAVRDGRVDAIVGLMSLGEWEGAASHRNLSAEWKVSIHAVAEYAREASGIVRRVVQDDPESIRAEILAGIEHVRVVAMQLVKPFRVGPDMYEDRSTPDVGAALRAYELRAKMLGLMVDELHLTGDLRGKTDAELDALAAELSRKLKPGG